MSAPPPSVPERRFWREGDRAKVSILQLFRSAHEAGDARRASVEAPDGSVEITARRRERREGMSEGDLRALIEADLEALFATVRLESSVDLTDAPHVARSILNYGFRDLSSLSQTAIGRSDVVGSLRQSLIDHEPRLVPQTVVVELDKTGNARDQRIGLKVSADLMGDPVDIPVDFSAEIDTGGGKMQIGRLRVET